MTQKRKRYDKQFKIAAARVVLGGEMRAVDLARELGIKNSTLGRWAQEHGGTGESAFPGNGSPKVNKDYEIAKLRKRVEEPGRENGLLKNFRAFLSQDHARDAGSPKSIGASSV
ncbi:transposase [Ellagibacter isourolithinifaciens]|uniref:transposase n=1 Tax=Ellagibacter isourolithinifaciens TaxID=2137581 RepID=UPI003A91ADA4